MSTLIHNREARLRMHARLSAGFAAAVLACAAGNALGQTTDHDDRQGSDWLRIVPGDVRFYIEFRDLAAAREKFRELGIWSTVLELREQDARRRTERSWQPQTEQLLGMDGESVITDLLGRRSAIFARSPAHWDDGLLLSQIESPAAMNRLLKQWNAKEMATDAQTAVRKFLLGGGLMLGVAADVMLIGPAGDPDGLWLRTTQLMEGQRGPSLAARADFAAVRSRLSPDPQGLLYAVWDRDDRAAFAGCRRMLVGVWMRPDRIICELRGHLSRPEHERTTLDAAAIDNVPVTALAAWAGGVDFAALRKTSAPVEAVETETVASIFQSTFGWVRSDQPAMVDSLGPECRFIVGRDPPALTTGFDLPAATLTCDVKNGEAIVSRLDGLIDLLAKAVAYLSTGDARSVGEIDVRRDACEGVPVHSTRVGPYLARRVKLDFLKNTEPSWALLDGQLVLSTSRGHVEEIIRAAREKAPGLGKMLGDMAPARICGDRKIVECFVLRGGAVSAMMSNWLTYLEEHHPQALKEEWWRDWAGRRMEERQRLGVALANDKTAPRRAVVVDVGLPSPAMGHLIPGDVILAAAGRPLETGNPAQEVADRYRARDPGKPFEFRVLRDKQTLDVPIVTPAEVAPDFSTLDLPGAVRQFSALVRRVETVTGIRFQTQPDRLEADLHIQWSARRR